jgi:hypothetical protein
MTTYEVTEISKSSKNIYSNFKCRRSGAIKNAIPINLLLKGILILFQMIL